MKKQFRNYGLVYQLCGILAIEDTKEKGAWTWQSTWQGRKVDITD